jgi:hypothetical protein
VVLLLNENFLLLKILIIKNAMATIKKKTKQNLIRLNASNDIFSIPSVYYSSLSLSSIVFVIKVRNTFISTSPSNLSTSFPFLKAMRVGVPLILSSCHLFLIF